MLNKKEIEKVAERLQEIGLTCYFIGGSIVTTYADNIGTISYRFKKNLNIVNLHCWILLHLNLLNYSFKTKMPPKIFFVFCIQKQTSTEQIIS